MIRTVMFFVDEPRVVGAWWARAFDVTVQDEAPFYFVVLDGVEVGFHPSDAAANPFGASCVPYFAVEDLASRRTQLLERGCAPHRGPLRVGDDRWVAQLVDPFGDVFGLDGPATVDEDRSRP